MPPILAILRHTPIWVFVLLIVLVMLGLQGLRARRVAVWRLLLVPAIFIIWGAVSLVARFAAAPFLVIDWLVAGATGFAVGWLTLRLAAMQIDRATGVAHVAGSVVPLVRNLAIFLAKYCLAVASAIVPSAAPALAHWDIGVSGLSFGYFLAWLCRFAIKYRAAQPAPAGAPEAAVRP